MGSFDDLPKDIVWLILRDVLIMSYGFIKEWDLTGQFIVAQYPGGMTCFVIPLSSVCKRFRVVLKSKSRWGICSLYGTPRWGFI
jgi:hypothetical protein